MLQLATHELLRRIAKLPAPSLRRTIYFGTENTHTIERYEKALERAIAMRSAAEEAYQKAGTRAKRVAAREMKVQLLAA